MSKICWGVEGAQGELEKLTRNEEKIVLNVVEVPHTNNRYFYEVRMQPDAATVDVGSAFKNCAQTDAWCRYPDEYRLRKEISLILNTPHACYQRPGEKVLAALGLGHFRLPSNGKHLSPHDELKFIHAALSCAEIIGFRRIPYIGRTETPDSARLREALQLLQKQKMAESYR